MPCNKPFADPNSDISVWLTVLGAHELALTFEVFHDKNMKSSSHQRGKEKYSQLKNVQMICKQVHKRKKQMMIKHIK